MSSTGMRALVAITVLVVGAAVFVVRDRAAASRGSASEELLFPGLTEAINDIEVLTVGDGEQSVTIRSGEGGWQVDELSGFPADFDQVKKTLVAVAQLRTLEPKTRIPERYASLGVEEPAGEETGSTLVTLTGPDGDPLAELIVGNRKSGAKPAHYVRVKDQAQSWLAQGDLSMETDPKSWVERELLRLPAERVREVTVAHPDGTTLTLVKELETDTNWQVRDVPEDKQLTSPGIGRSVAAALAYLDLEDVQPASDVEFPAEDTVTTTFKTFDGLTLTATTVPHEDKYRVKLQASFSEDDVAPDTTEDIAEEGVDEEDAKARKAARERAQQQARKAKIEQARQEAEDLAARFGDWAFTISQWKATALTKRMDDMVKDKVEEQTDLQDEAAPAQGSQP